MPTVDRASAHSGRSREPSRPPRCVVGAPVLLGLAVIFAAALVYDQGAMAGSGAATHRLFMTQIAQASVLPVMEYPEVKTVKTVLKVLLMFHGFLTASIVVFLAALSRCRGSDYFGSAPTLEAVLFCVFFRTGASLTFCHTLNYHHGLCAWISGGIGWCGLARAFAKEAQVAYPSRLKDVPFFLGDHRHVPVVGYAVGGVLSCLAILPWLRPVVEVAGLAVVFGDFGAIHRAWSMLPKVLPGGDEDGNTIRQHHHQS